ncbi:MAG: Hsp20 family protein [Candidatus Microthrix sp.]|nr:Hsp20/alpha crystallin family protein [Candidatus Microthrix sp.]MBK7322090.1 Hsp20 family protein [Candidatus Microthrix sp.]
MCDEHLLGRPGIIPQAPVGPKAENVAKHEEVLASTREAQHRLEASPQRVPINAYRSDAAFVVVAPVPGVSPEDVHVELRHGTVRFWTNVRSATHRTYDLHEWHYGGYERTIEVPDGFGASVSACLGHGQLVIRVAAGPFGGEADRQATGRRTPSND